ncbi:MAG TPA: M23 family metallopeptidase [Myxococcales bacterium]|nr:M23 family metallopeptidase [Myxococcales bacterium]
MAYPSPRIHNPMLWLIALVICLGAALGARSFRPLPEHPVAQPWADSFSVAPVAVGSPLFAPEAAPGAPTPWASALRVGESGAVETGFVAEFPPVSIESLPLHGTSLVSQAGGAKKSLTVVTRGTLRRGESLSIALRRQGIDFQVIHTIATEFGKIFDFRRARPGDEYRLGQEASGRLVDFRYSVSPEKSFYLYATDSGYRVREDHAQLRAQVAKVVGQIDSSLYGTIKELGERSQLASDFADIFAWDIDFSRSVQPGDDFEILFERMYRTSAEGAEVYVKPGRILAARYRGRNGDYSAVFFEGDKGYGRYYRPDGSSVERAFLVAPLKFSRISSSFSTARRHPILDVVRPHRGIDYAAAHGTPLWSVGAGRVIFRGWAGGSGNLVKVKHRNGYVSYYAHLSRFEPGLKVGSSVEQKQVIGYVGDTGLATGPHVCFRVQKNGRYVNPLDISAPAGDPVTEPDRERFESVRDLLLADLGTGMQIAADEAL